MNDIMEERTKRKAEIGTKEITFSQLKEIIRLELLDLQSSGHIILGKDEEGKIQSYCIAVEIEDALREPIYD